VLVVQVANRSTRTTKKERLLAELAEAQSITAACDEAGVKRRTYYQWYKDDPDFAAAADDALEQGTDGLEDEAVRRAKSGSDTLLIFLLKARRPDKYADRKQVDVNLTIRRKAEKLAEELGVPVEDVIAEAEAVAAEAWSSWSP
jgi:hypothetical protein